ncbi:DUF4123 domain-containing protein [Halopseudomonas pelagia]|uniref:DUF4123 domain-containing protein n=1 Tax=Halopseudomonas pelagia TaxID=553151 RepID=A0AA91Z661_9GAMM|nr:DUF4123 domain-containing protein [Halopseudomonas pelagia]PCC99240.1 hypothetical protein CO192_11455 [Halopseudomonas pelagia]QFY57665.1 DUF4123 domain-containing protein [Halopseudomonas pelagia]
MTTEYLLLDGVVYDQALPRLYGRDDDLEIEPLYSGTPWQEVADLGPILVRPGPRSTLLEEVENEPEWRTCAAKLSSSDPMVDVARHLRQFNKLTDTLGNERLLRYADPLVAWFWLNSCGPASLRRILGPIIEWQIVQPQCTWAPQSDICRHVFSSIEATDGEPLQKLGQAQMTGLEKAYHWQLKERLYVWLKENQPTDLARLPAEQIDTWLSERLTSADSFGVTSERSIAIWCALSLSQGDDFAAADEGVYQQWSVRQKGKPLHTADQRLQQYYQESV